MYYAAATAITSQTQPAASHQLNSAITAADAFFASPVEPLPHTNYQKILLRITFSVLNRRVQERE